MNQAGRYEPMSVTGAVLDIGRDNFTAEELAWLNGKTSIMPQSVVQRLNLSTGTIQPTQ